MNERLILGQVRAAVVKAMESRRGLVAFSRMEAQEMDFRAREVERDVLQQIRGMLPEVLADQQLHQVKTRLVRMDESLRELDARQDVQERSRALERDDITWKAFEDISWMLGIE